MKFPIQEIAGLLKGEIVGRDDIVIDNLSTLENAEEGCISFLSNPKYENYIYKTRASAVIVKNDFAPAKPVHATLIKVKDPYVSFSILLEEYDKLLSYQKEGIEEPSFIGEGSSTGESIYRGAFSYIGDNVLIGRNVKIFPHVYIGDGVQIGDNTILFSGVKIYANVKIGANCHIHAGAIIGSDGFGFAPQKDGTYKKIPQLGTVILEDNVDIGANTVIATKIGRNCVLAGQVGIAGHIEIGDKVTIGAQAGITKSFTAEGTVLLGSPAIPVGEFRRAFAIYKKLPEFHERMLRLEEKVKNFQEG
jgi:UDP-3-O-[3-hydroxymyristoyl] glucosamine N-acyltransferase